jgi:hypothetical protein
MSDTIALDRDALYYPYIHIHDVNWLKSTLLCFPSVHRIVPEYGHDASLGGDSPEIQQFCKIVGARGPLLQPSSLVWGHAATLELQRKIEANEGAFREYTLAWTKEEDCSRYTKARSQTLYFDTFSGNIWRGNLVETGDG